MLDCLSLSLTVSDTGNNAAIRLVIRQAEKNKAALRKLFVSLGVDQSASSASAAADQRVASSSAATPVPAPAAAAAAGSVRRSARSAAKPEPAVAEVKAAPAGELLLISRVTVPHCLYRIHYEITPCSMLGYYPVRQRAQAQDRGYTDRRLSLIHI